MADILIVDDDAQLRNSFERLLSPEGHTLRTAASGEAGLSAVKERAPDLVIMDVRLPGMDGLVTFHAMKKVAPRLPVIIMTAFGTTETAIEATKMGAFDYILKPFDIPVILDLIRQALKAGQFMRSRVEVGAAPGDAAPDALVGKSPVMQEVYKAIGRVAPTDATVLLRGESGTGKELVARALYQYSLRADKPFLVINCVAIPPTLLESELFGYEKGAFTGATDRRVGKIERANHGAIFLDEIGDMPFEIQSKILRLLQERSIERLGGREPINVDVRIIAATNRNLEKAVEEGRFREDLYYRLKVVTLTLPPLRERGEDVGLLADYFLARFSRDMGVGNPGVTREARELLRAHSWPGNVRELANAMQKALIFSRGFPLEPGELARATGQKEDFPTADSGQAEAEQVARSAASRAIRTRLSTAGEGESVFEEFMDAHAALILKEALTITAGNRTRAAKMLGMSRPTLLS
ncbi:MAG: sigma-54 dependent transcriptional regulator, partial [Proteobacteria bacterium]|nr:sigma-54 dependent transcriptional regulator [Pseudomonadota bacterium]